MREVYLRFVLAFLVLAAQISVAQALQTDPRLDLFLKKYDEVKDRLVPMGHEDSPFYRYYDRRFESGLDTVQRKLLHKVQKKGDCILADSLMIEGFIGLFPFLGPVFENINRRSKLSILMSNSSPPETTRCHNHSSMRVLFARRKRDEFPPVDFAELHPNYQEWEEEEKRDPGLKKLRLTLGGFGNAAFCDDYRPSIADLRAIVNRPGGMALTPEEELFLLERARMHNLEISDYNKIISRLKKHFSSSEAFLRLRDASRRGKLVDIPFPVDGYWQESCRNFARFRREEK
jgi:hypothetical protein